MIYLHFNRLHSEIRLSNFGLELGFKILFDLNTIDKGQIDNSQHVVDNCTQQRGHLVIGCEWYVTRMDADIMEQRDQMDQSQEGITNSDESANVNTTDPKGESAIVQTSIDNLDHVISDSLDPVMLDI